MLLSVVIPTYNRWPLVAEAVDSVLQQDLSDHEVIVVDDGSTDGTGERLASAFPEVRVLVQENSERGAARNRGIGAARGRYVGFLDADDLYEPWHVSEFARAARRHPEAPAFSAPARFWNPVRMRTRALPDPPPAPIRDAVLLGTVLPVQGLIVAREAAKACGGFPDDRSIAGSEDWVFLVRLARTFRIVLLPRPSVLIREHTGRSMNDGSARISSCRAATALLLREGVAGRPFEVSEQRLIRGGCHRFCASTYYSAGEMKAARRELGALRREVGLAGAARMGGEVWLQTWLGALGSKVARRLKSAVT